MQYSVPNKRVYGCIIYTFKLRRFIENNLTIIIL